MRRDKFRAWDKKYRKMIFKEFHLLGEVMAFNMIEQYLAQTKSKDDVPTILRWNDIEITRFTGIKDKNKNEVYYGDLILVPDNYFYTGKYDGAMVIEEYEGNTYAIDIVDGFGLGSDFVTRLNDDCVNRCLLSEFKNNFEIIGNIYEGFEIRNEKS